MIRIYKHPIVPSSLLLRKSWNEEDVIGQLQSDQNCKCYICERIQVTDFQVEHHRSRTNHPTLTFEWSNLFWASSYCNAKKSSSFDNLLNPVENNIEDIIHQSFDFLNSKAVFSNTEAETEGTEETIAFLTRVFNGTNGLRTIREQRLYDYAISKITSFQKMVINWLSNSNDETQNAIIEELDIKSEFLGFKYWIIKSNETLFSTFRDYIRWHKP